MADLNGEDMVTLFTEDDELETDVKVNRLKLINYSAYYRGLSSSGMRDAGLLKLTVPDATKFGLQTVAGFVEADDKQTVVPTSLDKLEEVIAAASYLQMDELISLCSQQLMLHICKCWNLVLYITRCYGLANVRRAACKHLSKNLLEMQSAENWNNFKDLPVEELCLVLDDDDCFATEREIFDVAMLWLKHEAQRMTLYASDVLAAVRFLLMSSDELRACADELASSEILPSCYRTLLKEARSYKAGAAISSHRTRLRCSIDVVIALGGFTPSEQTTNRFQILPIAKLLEHSTQEIRKTEFVRISLSGSQCSRGLDAGHVMAITSNDCLLPAVETSMPVERAERHPHVFLSCRYERMPVRLCEHSACVLNDVLYVAGGQQRYNLDGRYTTHDLYAFDLKRCTWSKRSPMNIPRSLFYLGELNRQLYAVAGWMAVNEDTSSVERYTPSRDSWDRLSDFPLDVHEHAGCQHKGQLYVSGGFRGPVHGHISQFCCYNAEWDVWQQRAPLSQPRSYHSMVSVRDDIIVAGGVRYRGEDDFDDLSLFQQPTSLPLMSAAGTAMLVSHNPDINLAIPSTLTLCEVYDVKSDQWTLVAQLPYPASCQSHVVISRTPLEYSNKDSEDIAKELVLFGGHSFSSDSDHRWLQRLTQGSDGRWHVERSLSLFSHAVLYHTATIATLPVHYVRQFE